MRVFYTLTPEQQAYLEEIQTAMIRNAVEAVSVVDRRLEVQVKAMTARLAKNGWKKPQIRRELRKLLTVLDADIQKQLLAEVEDAGKYAQRYIDRLRRYDVEQMDPIKPSELVWAREELGKGAARAAAAYARGRTAGEPKALLGKKGKIALSSRLHKMSEKQIHEATRSVLRAMREAQELDFASRELVDAAKGIGKGEKLPKLLRKVQEKVNNLELLTGEELTEEISQIREYAKKLKGGVQISVSEAKKRAKKLPKKSGDELIRLARAGKKIPGGRVQGAYMELVNDLNEGGAVKGAIRRWAYQKQRHHAESVLISEKASAFRQRQAQNSEGKPWIIGYKVKMQQYKHARFVARKPGVHRASKLAKKIPEVIGKHCLCEAFHNRVITPEEYREIYYRGFHTRCVCRFLEVIDREKLWET